MSDDAYLDPWTRVTRRLDGEPVAPLVGEPPTRRQLARTPEIGVDPPQDETPQLAAAGAGAVVGMLCGGPVGAFVGTAIGAIIGKAFAVEPDLP